jgi:hypothetical protein
MYIAKIMPKGIKTNVDRKPYYWDSQKQKQKKKQDRKI